MPDDSSPKNEGKRPKANRAETAPPETAASTQEAKAARREIPGNLPYLTSHGRLAEALKGLIHAERPQKFNEDFLDSVLGLRGGSARAIPPVLKRIGLLNPDNSPSELYTKFKSEYSRSEAALQALRNGYREIFKRNEYAHKLSDDRIKDIIVEITGLKKTDPIVGTIFGTFSAILHYARDADDNIERNIRPSTAPEGNVTEAPRDSRGDSRQLNLVTTVSIVLPETTDVQVYNAIFRALREHIIQ